MYYSENGDELKLFNTLGGMGLRILQEHGISKESSKECFCKRGRS